MTASPPKKNPSALAKARIYLVDDHPLVRAGLKALIATTSDLEICGESEEAGSALSAIVGLRPDVAVIDLSLQGGSGEELVRQIARAGLGTRICVLSIHDDPLHAERARHAGAASCLSKRLPATAVLAALRRLARGEDLPGQPAATGASADQPDVASRRADSDLTPRELEIAKSIGQGLTVQAIASALKISVRAVEAHRRDLKKKMKLGSALELLRFCYAIGGGQSEAPAESRKPVAVR